MNSNNLIRRIGLALAGRFCRTQVSIRRTTEAGCNKKDLAKHANNLGDRSFMGYRHFEIAFLSIQFR